MPIVITGASGAGKTEVWRRLTGNQAPDAPSRGVEEGYLFKVRSRPRVAITAIPGQVSKERYDDLNFYFGSEGRLDGVIFVASFGFDRIWPQDVDLVAANLPEFSVNALRQRNVARELESFRETCEQLRRRNLADRNLPSPWLLVIVNKADLYWKEIAVSNRYYGPGSGSAFDEVVKRLKDDLGNAAGFRYAVLPVCLQPADYLLSSYRGSLKVDSQLDQSRANSSIDLIIDMVKELTDG